MKDDEPKVDPQIDMIQDRYGIMRQVIKFNVKYLCKTHLFATENDLIEVYSKRKDAIVKRCRFCEDVKARNKIEAKKEWQTEKEAVSDYYVRRNLTRGSKMKMHEIPAALVETKAALIKIKRLTDKLNGPLKKCNKHGNLYKDQVIKAGKEKSGNAKYRCRACMKELHAKNYQLNKAMIRTKHKAYREANKEKVAIQKRESRLKNQFKYVKETSLINSYARYQDHLSKKKRKHNFDRDNALELSDKYIKRLLTKRSGLKTEEIPDALVQCKRVLVQLQQGIQQKRDEKIFNYTKEQKNGKNKKY